MGFSIMWLAVAEQDAGRLLDRLGLQSTGRYEQAPDSLIATAALETGWRVIWYNNYDCPFLRDKDIRALSEDFDFVVCRVEEHVMASSAERWNHGTRSWWVSHEGEHGPWHLDVHGELPSDFESIRKHYENEQRVEDQGDQAVDHIFEIPLKLAQMVVGFKHDERDPQFEVLKSRSTQASGGLLRKLFGR